MNTIALTGATVAIGAIAVAVPPAGTMYWVLVGAQALFTAAALRAAVSMRNSTGRLVNALNRAAAQIDAAHARITEQANG